MAEVVLTQDVEALVVSALNAALTTRGDAARVSTKVPATRPARFGRVRRRGGPRQSVVVDVPLLLIEAWDAAGEAAAADLCGLLCGLVAALPDGGRITEAEILSGPSNDPDPDSSTPRYTATAQLWVNSG